MKTIFLSLFIVMGTISSAFALPSGVTACTDTDKKYCDCGTGGSCGISSNTMRCFEPNGNTYGCTSTLKLVGYGTSATQFVIKKEMNAGTTFTCNDKTFGYVPTTKVATVNNCYSNGLLIGAQGKQITLSK